MLHFALLAYVLLSFGYIPALIPILVILVLLVAAGATMRGYSIFNLFGIATLAGIGTGSKGSLRGKSTFSVLMYFFPQKFTVTGGLWNPGSTYNKMRGSHTGKKIAVKAAMARAGVATIKQPGAYSRGKARVMNAPGFRHVRAAGRATGRAVSNTYDIFGHTRAGRATKFVGRVAKRASDRTGATMVGKHVLRMAISISPAGLIYTKIRGRGGNAREINKLASQTKAHDESIKKLERIRDALPSSDPLRNHLNNAINSIKGLKSTGTYSPMIEQRVKALEDAYNKRTGNVSLHLRHTWTGKKFEKKPARRLDGYEKYPGMTKGSTIKVLGHDTGITRPDVALGRTSRLQRRGGEVYDRHIAKDAAAIGVYAAAQARENQVVSRLMKPINEGGISEAQAKKELGRIYDNVNKGVPLEGENLWGKAKRMVSDTDTVKGARAAGRMVRYDIAAPVANNLPGRFRRNWKTEKDRVEIAKTRGVGKGYGSDDGTKESLRDKEDRAGRLKKKLDGEGS